MKQQLQKLLNVSKKDDGTWIAAVPEMSSMWSKGNTEQEAIAKWMEEYDQPFLYPVFASVFQERMAAMKPGLVTVTEVKDVNRLK